MAVEDLRDIWRSDEGGPVAASKVRKLDAGNIWDEGAVPTADERRQTAFRSNGHGPTTAPAVASVEEIGLQRQYAPRSRTGAVLGRVARIGVALLVVAVLADGAFVAFGLTSSLNNVQGDLQSARDSIEAGDLPAADEAVSAANDHADDASAFTEHPAFWIAQLLPDGRAADRVVSAASTSADAAGSLLAAAQSLGASDGDLAGAAYSDGRVDLAAVERALPDLEQANTGLTEAESLLGEAPSPLLPVMEERLADARSVIGDAQDSVETGARLLSIFPGLLGSGEPRDYLLAFQALGEARGTGGVVGVYGILHAADGSIDLGHIGPYSEFATLLEKPVPSPIPSFRRNYASQLALRQWPQANLTPNFPVASEVMLRMYERGTGEDLDGVIGMDPKTLEPFLDAIGPLTAPGLETIVTADNVAQVLMKDIYLDFGSERKQNAYLGALVKGFWQRLESGDIDSAALVKAVGEAAATGHLRIYSRDDSEQQELRALRVAGHLAEGEPNMQMVFHNNYGVNKVDIFLQRRIKTMISIDPEGDARITTTVKMRNEAPVNQPPSLLLGEGGTGLPDPGVNRMDLNVLLPKDAQAESMRVDGDQREPIITGDTGHPVMWEQVVIPPAEATRVSVTYFHPGAADISAEGGTFAFNLQPQVRAIADTYSLRVIPPEGFEFEIGGQASRSFERAGNLERPASFYLDIVADD